MAFIIDSYNKYDIWDRQHARYKFRINGNWYAIKEVILFWGVPQLGMKVDQSQNPEAYFIYDTYEEALEFAKKMKSLN